MSTQAKTSNTRNRASGANAAPGSGDSGFSIQSVLRAPNRPLMGFICVGFQDGLTPESRFHLYRVETTPT
jgi:hypothetical protein